MHSMSYQYISGSLGQGQDVGHITPWSSSQAVDGRMRPFHFSFLPKICQKRCAACCLFLSLHVPKHHCVS